MEPFHKDKPHPEEAVNAIGRTIPLGRVGQPKDIAQNSLLFGLARGVPHHSHYAG